MGELWDGNKLGVLRTREKASELECSAQGESEI